MNVPEMLRRGWRRGDPPEALLEREWLVTNGLGGYATGTISGACTRRYHGYLIAALPVPLGRVMMLNHLSETLVDAEGLRTVLSGDETSSGPLVLPTAVLESFYLDRGMPVWRFEHQGVVMEKRVHMPHLQNTVHVMYRLLAGPSPLVLEVRPALSVRHHDGSVATEARSRGIAYHTSGAEISAERCPVLRLVVRGSQHPLVLNERTVQVLYRVERDRGYDAGEPLWSPGVYLIHLEPGRQATVVASTEDWQAVDALSPDEALEAERQRRARLLARAHPVLREGPAAELVLAADQFIVTPHTRPHDEQRARAEGDEARSLVAGYHWFTDWGRDTMISLEGLTLITGRMGEAASILRTFARHIQAGLIPNNFPDDRSEPAYHTADATLWFFHALARYEQLSGDGDLRRGLLSSLQEILVRHLEGTRFGISVDRRDGLLRQGAEGYQLTWMDAKVDGWVVTPRRGKAVEINALFYNALRLCAEWTLEQHGREAARPFNEAAERLKESFDRRFWYAEGDYLYDVVDGEQGDDASLRPNQLLAISLPHPVLDRHRWRPVLDAVTASLLTPVGLRSLDPRHSDYRQRYDGDLRSRDAAYHQGTVWMWLLGPYIEAWLKVNGDDRARARRMLDGVPEHLGDGCIGSLSEIFDAEPPFWPRGCIAQAWSVAEALRCYRLTAPGP